MGLAVAEQPRFPVVRTVFNRCPQVVSVKFSERVWVIQTLSGMGCGEGKVSECLPLDRQISGLARIGCVALDS
jgi:hypothetical protein